MALKTKQDEERFLAKVKTGDPDDCWEWQASLNSGGYGTFQYLKKQRIASRLAWVLFFGEIPDGLWVLHRCDNPPCVNPNHLFLGTVYDNIRDRDSKGRQAKETNVQTRKTHCPKGHPYIEGNIYRHPTRNGRTCIACQKAKNKGPQPPKTHCKYGHLYTEESTYIHENGHRSCRICRIEKCRILNEKIRLEKLKAKGR